MNNDQQLDDFLESMSRFETAMLVTWRGGELRSRPMAISGSRSDGRLYFVTSVDSGKLEEITDEPRVNVSMQAPARFLSVSGTARAVRDKDLLDEMWSHMDAIWFSEGRNDPSVILLEIVPTCAEYWDRSGTNAIKFALTAAAGALRGEPPDEDMAGAHGKLRFANRAKH